MPSGLMHQKPTAAPPLPCLPPPLTLVRLAHDPEFLPHGLAQPVRALELPPRTPVQPVHGPEFSRLTPERLMRGPEFQRRDPARRPLAAVAPVHAAERTRRSGADRVPGRVGMEPAAAFDKLGLVARALDGVR